MKLNHQKALVLLYILTIATALISTYYYGLSTFVAIILGLSAIKFMLVAFQFMEMKRANGFWKFIIIFYLVVFVGAVSVILR